MGMPIEDPNAVPVDGSSLPPAANGEPTDENLAYKAPEILEGRIPTLASDNYALGVIAYQTLTGNMPFTAGSSKELLREQRAGLATQPSDIRSDINSSVDKVFRRALSPDPLDRYPTAREFGDALYAALTAGEESVDAGEYDTVPGTGLIADVEPQAANNARLPRLSMP